jgi:hypothetical protein
MAMAASMMCRILLDYAHARSASKGPDSAVRIPLSGEIAQDSQNVQFLDLNSALEALAALDER